MGVIKTQRHHTKGAFQMIQVLKTKPMPVFNVGTFALVFDPIF